jgi:hypothetical protein
MDYRLAVAENYTDSGQWRRKATISLGAGLLAIFDGRRTCKV